MKCGNCYAQIKSGEPIEVTEYFKLEKGKRTLLGRDTQHYSGYGCKIDELEVEYPHCKL